MKKNNKGFSLVELIIVIAIMAILAGALAPSLIKYINKSRRSTDISNADTIATAITTALADEEGYDDCEDGTEYTSSDLTKGSETNSFLASTAETLGTSSMTAKYDAAKGKDFYAVINKGDNEIKIYAGEPKNGNQVYPDLGGIYKE